MSQAREIGGYRHAEADVSVYLRQLVLSPAIVNTITCAEQIFAMVGVLATDTLLTVNKPTEQAGVGAFPQRVSTAGNVAVKFVNPTAGNLTPTASEIYTFALARR